MKEFHLHSVTVDINTLDILSADTDFYAYIGNDRLYNTFEKFIHPISLGRFMSIVENRNSSPFVIDIVDNYNNAIPTYMSIEYENDNMFITLEPVKSLVEGQEQYRSLYNMTLDLMGLHRDVGFIYNSADNIIKIYTPDFRRVVKEYSLDNFYTELKSRVVETEYHILDDLFQSFKIKSGSFAFTFTGSILPDSEPSKQSFVKGMYVEDIENISIIGYVHRGNNKVKASYTMEKDALTGTYSKKEITDIARKSIEIEHQHNLSLCIIDIDYFKSVNDNFGHMTGDKVLKDVAKIITTEVGNMGVVGRFGGDEFVVLFYGVEDMELCREKLRSIKNIVNTKFPKTEDNSKVSITLSIGCAAYPKDANNYDDLFALADFCLYRAKDKGRNRYIIYNKEKHGTLEEIKQFFNNNRRIDSRKDMAMGDVLCMIEDKHYCDDTYTPELLADDLVENLSFERIICLTGAPVRCRCMSGINLPSTEIINKYAEVLFNCSKGNRSKNNVFVVNNIEILKNTDITIYEAFCEMATKSFILISFKDAAGKDSLISLEMTTTTSAWNLNQMYNYRAIARMFSRFVL